MGPGSSYSDALLPLCSHSAEPGLPPSSSSVPARTRLTCRGRRQDGEGRQDGLGGCPKPNTRRLQTRGMEGRPQHTAQRRVAGPEARETRGRVQAPPRGRAALGVFCERRFVAPCPVFTSEPSLGHGGSISTTETSKWHKSGQTPHTRSKAADTTPQRTVSRARRSSISHPATSELRRNAGSEGLLFLSPGQLARPQPRPEQATLSSTAGSPPLTSP